MDVRIIIHIFVFVLKSLMKWTHKLTSHEIYWFQIKLYYVLNYQLFGGVGWGDDLCLIFMNVCFFLKVFKGLQYHNTSISTQILFKKNLKNNSNMLSVKKIINLFKCFLNVLKTDKYVLDPKIHVLCQYHQQNYTYHKLCFLNDIN